MRSIEELITRHRPGHALDRRFYTDPDIYALELERIVTRHWVLAGHASELTGPGDFKRVDVADESAIVLNTARGLRSRYYEPGPLSTMEQVQGAYLDWLLEQLGSAAASDNRP